MLEKPVPPPSPPVEPSAPSPATPAVEPTPPTEPGAPGSRRDIGALKSHLTASGTARTGITAFNVAGSPFGEYDKALMVAVQSRWYALVDKNGLYERAGTVTVQFFLQSDGTLKTDGAGRPLLQTKDDGAGVVLASFCEKAILDSAPFPPFSEELKTLIGSDAREIDFTFYY
jgi:hypothetical protein